MRSNFRRPDSPVAALGVLVDVPRVRDLVSIEHITLVVLYDLPRGLQVLALCVASFTASRVSHGVQWGGLANRRFCKDLALQPAPHGQGYQLDLFEAEAVDLALRLNWRIDTALRYQRSAARASLRLPRLWAGFAADAAAEVRGDGPELAALAARFDLPAEALMAKFRRERSGQTLYPLTGSATRRSRPPPCGPSCQAFRSGRSLA